MVRDLHPVEVGDTDMVGRVVGDKRRVTKTVVLAMWSHRGGVALLAVWEDP